MKWQTRLICVYTAATVQVEKEGDKNPLLESALKIGEDETDSDDNDAPAKPLNDPDVGSYERFMSTFGSSARWAGH